MENDWTEEYLPGLTENDKEAVESVQRNIGYFIFYDNPFSSYIAKGSGFSAENVTDTLSIFSRLINSAYEKPLDDSFATFQAGLSKLGETFGTVTRAICELTYLNQGYSNKRKAGL